MPVSVVQTAIAQFTTGAATWTITFAGAVTQNNVVVILGKQGTTGRTINAPTGGGGTFSSVVSNAPTTYGGMIIWAKKETNTGVTSYSCAITGGSSAIGSLTAVELSGAADAVTKWGTLRRQVYGRHDLTKYDGNRAKEWGRPRAGLPDDLEPEAAPYRVGTASLVTSCRAARDAIANGYPVPVCSDVGLTDRRDSEGFAKRSGSWAHCMAFLGVDDNPRRPGLLCQNSWGPDWISGPTRHGQPPGSFWVDADVCDIMLGRQPDSYALSGFKGYPAQSLDYLMV